MSLTSCINAEYRLLSPIFRLIDKMREKDCQRRLVVLQFDIRFFDIVVRYGDGYI